MSRGAIETACDLTSSLADGNCMSFCPREEADAGGANVHVRWLAIEAASPSTPQSHGSDAENLTCRRWPEMTPAPVSTVRAVAEGLNDRARDCAEQTQQREGEEAQLTAARVRHLVCVGFAAAPSVLFDRCSAGLPVSDGLSCA